MNLCRLQRVDRDLRRAVETEGETNGADPPIDIKLHAPEAEVTLDIFLAQGRKYQGAVKRNADLAAVGVAGEHKIDGLRPRMLDDDVRVVGLVNHKDDRAIGSL